MSKKKSVDLDEDYIKILRRIDGALRLHDENTPDDKLPAIVEVSDFIDKGKAILFLDEAKKQGLIYSYFSSKQELIDAISKQARDGYHYRPHCYHVFWDYGVWVQPDFRKRVELILHPNRVGQRQHKKLTLVYSRTIGFFLKGFPDVYYRADGGREKTLQSLYDHYRLSRQDRKVRTVLDAKILAGKVKTSEKVISNNVNFINKNFRKKLGLTDDLIIKPAKSGYVLNVKDYTFEEVDW